MAAYFNISLLSYSSNASTFSTSNDLYKKYNVNILGGSIVEKIDDKSKKTHRKETAVMTYVADIERCSTHDGPGLRTVVFLKGCPLNCAWCHNPECISFDREELYYPEKCIGCGRCAEGCVAGARVTCGREMTTDEVLAAIEKEAK